MPKNTKTKKVKQSLDEKISVKKKAVKQKLNDLSKSNTENEELKNMAIEDEKWQCSILLLVPQTHRLYDLLLQILVNLPENFTVITKDAVANTKERKSQKGSTAKTSVRSTSKSSKKSSKTTKSENNKSRKERIEETELVESSNNEDESIKLSLAIKNLVIGLRNKDIDNTYKSKIENKTDTTETEIKYKVLRDKVDNKTVVTEENLTSNENILHRFVILLGFYDPLLPEVLIKQNVLIKAIINVRNSIDNNFATYYSERLSSITAKSKIKSSRKSKKGSMMDGNVSNEYSVFLETVIEFLNTAEFLEKCKDVIFLNFSVKNFSTKAKEVGFKYKSELMGVFYKIRESWYKYKVYTEKIYVQNIPTSKSLNLDDAKIYNTLVSMVPLECASITVILHCILEQIAWWNDDKCFSEEKDNCSLNGNSTLCNSSTTSKTFRNNKTPILVHHRDEIKHNNFHLELPEFDFEQISINVFMKSPVFKLWERYPPHSKPVRKWFEFQMQKLKNLSDSSILKLDSLFPIYLHNLLMNVLVLKTIEFTNLNDKFTSEPEINNVHKIFSSGKESEVCDSNSNLFMKEILYNILCKIPNFFLSQNYSNVLEVNPNFSVETNCSLKQSVHTNMMIKNSSKNLPDKTLLQKRKLHKQEKLNKLLSFLHCSEFVNLYDDLSKLNLCETNILAKYGYVEFLNTQTLCQCLHSASQAFSNINYDYFPVTDSILLWFNNSEQDQVFSSNTSKAFLQTPLGFRDFYSHKLKESTDFGDMNTEEVASINRSENNGDLFVDKLEESCADHHSKVENRKNHISVEAPDSKIVYNLGSLWMESTESFNNYFSVDSSSVTVKRATYFNNKVHNVVNINKNNTSLRYEPNTEGSNNFVQLVIDVKETLILNCVLKWDNISVKSSIQKNNTQYSKGNANEKDIKFKLNCSLRITLPSGLFIEVVPTSSIFGPFYIRQRYLAKGPNCNNIWDETYRCYFNNGMVLIFRVDGSVDILYNNGTTVKCCVLLKPDNLSDFKGTQTDANIKEEFKTVGKSDLNQHETNKTEENPNKQRKKEGKVKADSKKAHYNLDGKETNKESHQKKNKVNKEQNITEENQSEKFGLVEETDDIPLYKVIQHSVLSWDGKYSEYDSGNCTNMKKCLSLRTAFDVINHELYWQRSDGMSGLQAQGNHMIKFPDGTKTTSFTIDNKELHVEKDCAIIYYTSGDLVKVESFIVSHMNQSTGVESNKSNLDSNYKQNFLYSDIPSMDSFGTESFEEKSFAYIEDSFLMEHTNNASVKYYNEEHELKVMLPGNCWIIVDEIGRFSFNGINNERIVLFNESLLFEAHVLSTSTTSKSSTTIRFENVDTIPIAFSQTQDSFGNVFSVDERGNTTYLPFVSGDNFDHAGPPLMYSARFPQNTERFFVFNRDLTGYEMIHDVEQANTLSNEEVAIINTPLLKDDGELYRLYMQSPIYRTKCDKYSMHDLKDVTPSLIKKNNLLKTHKTPEKIWFYPEISFVKKLIEKNERRAAQADKTFKAMMIVQRLKVKKKGSDVTLLFSRSLSKYMEINEQIYQKYLSYHPKETLKEEDIVECEKNRMHFLGSKSYYLTDNLPVVIRGEMAKETESNKAIFSIFSPSVSNASFL